MKENHFFLEYDLYSLGFSILSPRGARERRGLVQVDSLFNRMENACCDLVGLLMDSRTWISMSGYCKALKFGVQRKSWIVKN